jgi:hypothetical protein
MKNKYYYTCSKCRIIKTDEDLDRDGVLPICPTCGDDLLQHKTK